ncbi:methionine adenosyltransferase [Mycoplasmopsis californica HAZ160_1]|uniref:S-adenosylmethionine synthase n=1 Tax=Mycoplasmopsis californica HAZ160_1 TaxID=1397850 RepID=A0AAT9F8C2_9BACT|nr:methionine adenosyltransferase [Mycoplasmopsis californica]BAP01154.1 methionine adenosyltransferase [Mycoplasmopsis californica HAZ160_1]BBG41020.1 methionine adenosyltransferase [Mycoplasmopsis californica]BBG41613.1 methionine adenosyltransferase [Mycoplasmopsis californica]BBG42207.1 methionine adenosyltransferase [Mycoplasmopsis californica]BBG42789.1 methionine adenosyltransferase [Mycoplasmopsis californica]
MEYKKLFTSESVGQGHPDKVCDQISDTILDAYLVQDKYSRVAVETMASGKTLFISGEVSSTVTVDSSKIAENILKKLGYFTDELKIIVDIKQQSPDISQGVDLGDEEIGAGDQGIMFGYATNETPNFMPLAHTLAQELVKKADKLRQSGEFKWAKADMKSQVTVDYTNPEKTTIDTVLLSIQHDENFNELEFKNFIKKFIIAPVLAEYGFDKANKILINPTGRFVIGGPIGDTGLTGRKIIVDTYGGAARHGGGAFSGKDYTKVDRSAAYACRWIAKNLVASRLADRVEIQVSYAIGVAEPVSVSVYTFGTEKVERQLIEEVVWKLFDLRPYEIIKNLKLRDIKYAPTSYFGHFGRQDLDLPWERLNKVEEIKEFVRERM